MVQAPVVGCFKEEVGGALEGSKHQYRVFHLQSSCVREGEKRRIKHDQTWVIGNYVIVRNAIVYMREERTFAMPKRVTGRTSPLKLITSAKKHHMTLINADGVLCHCANTQDVEYEYFTKKP